MNILTEGYLDRNFGDDMMIRIAAYYLAKHELFIHSKRREVLEPFKGTSNIHILENGSEVKFDFILRITGSGFFIKSKRDLFEYIVNSFKRKKTSVPKGVIGCNIGPFYNKFAKMLIMRELKEYSVITVRESFSEKYIQHAKTKLYCPDILFALPDEWLPSVKGEGCLGISAYRLRFADNLDIYKKLAQCADLYIEETGKKVILFAFDIEEENDLCAAVTIKSFCKNKEMVEIAAHTDDGSTIIKNFMRCSKVVGIRFHSCILAMRLGIPFVPLMYSQKTDNVLDDAGYTGKRFYLNNFSTKELSEEIRNSSVFLPYQNSKKQATEHFEVIKNYLEHLSGGGRI